MAIYATIYYHSYRVLSCIIVHTVFTDCYIIISELNKRVSYAAFILQYIFLFKIILYVKMIIVKYILYTKCNIGVRKYFLPSNFEYHNFLSRS